MERVAGSSVARLAHHKHTRGSAMNTQQQLATVSSWPARLLGVLFAGSQHVVACNEAKDEEAQKVDKGHELLVGVVRHGVVREQWLKDN